MAIRVDEDIRPLSEFRAGVASFVSQIQETGRPMVLTQHGRGVAVLMDAHGHSELRGPGRSRSSESEGGLVAR